MRYRYLFVFALVFIFTSCLDEKKSTDSEEKVTSTYYFIRHAEKDRSDSSDKDPHLTEIGQLRATQWSEILGEVKFDAVYSTDYNRTRETSQPTAAKNNLEIKLYDPRNMDVKSFMEETKGKTVLVVGHSNTTPDFVNKLVGHNKYDEIDDSNNGNLYIVSVTGDNITDQLLVIN